MFWNISRINFYIFSKQKMKSNCYITFLNFFPIIFFWWKIYSSLVIFIYKRFNFYYSFQIFFLFLHNLTQMLQRVEDIYYPFYWWELLLCFWFLSNQENLYMIHHDFDFFYDICNTINEHNRRQTSCFLLILNYFDTYF